MQCKQMRLDILFLATALMCQCTLCMPDGKALVRLQIFTGLSKSCMHNQCQNVMIRFKCSGKFFSHVMVLKDSCRISQKDSNHGNNASLYLKGEKENNLVLFLINKPFHHHLSLFKPGHIDIVHSNVILAHSNILLRSSKSLIIVKVPIPPAHPPPPPPHTHKYFGLLFVFELA